jgi:hypothetical protein
VSNERKQVLLRIDPRVHDALARWAADEFRSLNAHVEMLLRRAPRRRGSNASTRGAPAQAGPTAHP